MDTELALVFSEALTTYAEERVSNEYAKGALDQQKRCTPHMAKARSEGLAEGRSLGFAEAREMAAEISEGVGGGYADPVADLITVKIRAMNDTSNARMEDK